MNDFFLHAVMWWAVAGFFLSPCFSTPRSRRGAIHLALFLGPLAWGIILLFGAHIKIKEVLK